MREVWEVAGNGSQTSPWLCMRHAKNLSGAHFLTKGIPCERVAPFFGVQALCILCTALHKAACDHRPRPL